MAQAEFHLPDVGEGLTEAEIVHWKVAPGDTVTVNQVLLDIETAKSLVELPSPFAGTVTALLVEEGATVEVGTPLVRVDSTGGSIELQAPGAGGDAFGHVTESTGAPPRDAEEGSGAVLVGYGSQGGHGATRRRRAASPAPSGRSAEPARPRGEAVIAKPPIRKLAKDLAVDLHRVVGTGPGGEILREDVIAGAEQASVFRNIQTPEWPSDREERIPVKGVRKATAAAMVKSAYSAPHVSVFTDVNATRTMEFVRRLKDSTDFAGVRVSPLLVMARAVIWAVRRNPTVNSTWTDKEIVVHHYVNLGIAAATPRGLIVPNVKDAQNLSMLELARSLEQLTATARDGKSTPADMSHGTITITNLGSFGMDTGTPIINPGEAAIIALGAIKQKPWVVDGEVRPAWVMTVAAAFDHRIVDGDVASRFTADLAAIMEEPALLLD